MEYRWLIGVILAAVASLISNLGLNLQKLAHLNNAKIRENERQAFFKQPVWVAGLSLIIAGSICDFIALGFGNQSIIAPLGSLTLVANMFFAPLILGETISRSDVFATVIIVIGAIMCVAFASHNNETFTPEELFQMFNTTRFAVFGLSVISVLGGLLSFIHYIEGVKLEHPDGHVYRTLRPYHRFCYAAVAGVIGAQSVLFAKVSAELIVSSFTGSAFLLRYPQTYIVLIGLGVTIFLQLKWLNQGLANFDALYIVPVFQSFWILVSVLGGLIFFDEYNHMHGLSAVMFPVGVITTIFGVYLLSNRAISEDKMLLANMGNNSEVIHYATPSSDGRSDAVHVVVNDGRDLNSLMSLARQEATKEGDDPYTRSASHSQSRPRSRPQAQFDHNQYSTALPSNNIPQEFSSSSSSSSSSLPSSSPQTPISLTASTSSHQPVDFPSEKVSLLTGLEKPSPATTTTSRLMSPPGFAKALIEAAKAGSLKNMSQTGTTKTNLA